MINVDLGFIVGVVGAILGLLAWGSRSRQKEKADKAESKAEALAQAKEIQEDVKALDDDDLANEFDRMRAIREKRR